MQTRFGLVWTLVRTDFKARYHGSMNGFVWALLKPARMFLVLMTVFSFLFQDPAYKLNLIVGLCPVGLLRRAHQDRASCRSTQRLSSSARCGRRCGSWCWPRSPTPLLTLAVFATGIVVVPDGLGQRAAGVACAACSSCYLAALVVMVAGFSLAASVLFLRCAT